MMKRYFLQILAAVTALFCLSGCHKDDVVNISTAEVGEWHLVEWNGAEPQNFDIYLELLSDGTFNLYQKLQSADYSHFGGTYSLSGGYLDGVYDDGTAWTCRYSYSLDGSGDRLTLISCDDEAVQSIYERTDIPEDVRTGLFDRQ